MFFEEARWVAGVLFGPDEANMFPLLNLGAQSASYRNEIQPHINDLIFAPAERRGHQVVHTDLQSAEGVDYVGDLMDPDFRASLAHLHCRSVLCSNLLEHVPERRPLIDSICELVQENGYLIITVPYSYPYHPDPIDTRYRPAPDELAGQFSGFDVVATAVVATRTRAHSFVENPAKLARTLIRICIPFYRFRHWLGVVHSLGWLFRRPTVSCVVLKKRVGPEPVN